jgi:hypothetical protein
MSFGRRTFWIALVVGVAGVVGAILLVRALDAPQTLSEKLGDLMLVEAHHSCLDGKPSFDRFTAKERPDLYPDLLPRARSVDNVSCEDLGEVSTMVHFENRHVLQRAFRLSSSAKSSGWCVVDATAFDGAYLDHPWSLRYYCHRLHGELRPGPRQVSETGS